MKAFLKNQLFLWVYVFAFHTINGQTHKLGEAFSVSVTPINGATYFWELYDSATDFAKNQGNCPTHKAFFRKGNTSHNAEITFLQSGEYFYKVKVQDGCSQNIKIGKVLVKSTLTVQVDYHCQSQKATLRAENYSGELHWSTGQNTPSIEVSAGEYWVENIVNKVVENRVKVTVQGKENAPNLQYTTLKIPLGNSLRLSASNCQGNLLWFADSALTQPITQTEVTPKNSTTYYAVCQNKYGCLGEVATMYVRVTSLQGLCAKKYDKMFIPNALSANQDGKNDSWYIPDLLTMKAECGIQANVFIFNRWGTKVFEKSGYMLDGELFMGYSNISDDFSKTEKLPEGVYFYVIEFDKLPPKSGYIYLKR